jgi:hypothetical protein
MCAILCYTVYRGDDPFFERMTYLQAEDEAIIQVRIV